MDSTPYGQVVASTSRGAEYQVVVRNMFVSIVEVPATSKDSSPRRLSDSFLWDKGAWASRALNLRDSTPEANCHELCDARSDLTACCLQQNESSEETFSSTTAADSDTESSSMDGE